MSAERSPRLHRPGLDSLRTVSIIATGSYVPDRVLTNTELEKIVDTTDEWIYTRTGIRQRHIAEDHQATSDLAIAAARKAMENGTIRPEEIDYLIVATCTPDMHFPSTACMVQKELGATNAACVDLSAACSGFVYAIDMARQYIQSGTMNTALVIGAEKMSCLLDWEDRATCVLFGDGAGAAILQARGDQYGILTSVLGGDGKLGDLLNVPGGGSRLPITPEVLADKQHVLKMAGREVFKHAVTGMAGAAQETLRRCGATIDDVACIIPHQANARIIQAISQRIDAPMEKFYVNLDRFGNTSAASVIMAIDEAARKGRIQRGDLVLLVVFGAGFTWAASLLEW